MTVVEVKEISETKHENLEAFVDSVYDQEDDVASDTDELVLNNTLDNYKRNDSPVDDAASVEHENIVQPIETSDVENQPIESSHVEDYPVETTYVESKSIETPYVADQSIETSEPQLLETINVEDQPITTVAGDSKC